MGNDEKITKLRKRISSVSKKHHQKNKDDMQDIWSAVRKKSREEEKEQNGGELKFQARQVGKNKKDKLEQLLKKSKPRVSDYVD